ncbi:MAG: PorP/SprF family type IX secretion system membrane protein [Saprospiraceae bacterium]|nr:PorP/SprF family type IX secretion system membrane protein [Saprospiraceae bacterium]
MKKYVLVLYFYLSNWTLEAQQTPLFTQYQEYATIINPAAVTSDYFLNNYNMSFGASLRQQWLSLNRNPKTQILRGDYIGRTDNFFNISTGGYFMSDRAGSTDLTGLYGRLAIIGSNDPQKSGFSLGFSGGLARLSLNVSDVYVRDAADLSLLQTAKWFPDLGIGLFGYRSLSDKGEGDFIAYGGVSIPQILGNNIFFQTDQKQINVSRVRHFYGTAGLVMYVNSQSYFEQSVWIKYVVGLPIHYDFNLRYQMMPALKLGVGYSTSQTVHGEASFAFGEGEKRLFRIGYGFDYAFGTEAPFFGATHEVNLVLLLDNR